MVRSAVIVLAAGASLTDALQVQPIVRTTHARAATPTMQFGFQNYDREVEAEKRGSNPINYLNPFATGSTEYPYGEKELKKSINIAGIELPTFGIDPRVPAAVTILGLIGFLPVSIVALVAVTPGTQSPFKFLDRFYPPAVEAKLKKDPAARKAKADAEAKKVADEKKAADDKKKAETEAKAKKEAEAKAKAAAEAKSKKEAEAKTDAGKAKAEAEAKAAKEAAEKAAKKAAEEKEAAAAAAAKAEEEAIAAAAKAKAEAKAAAERARYEETSEYRREMYFKKQAEVKEANLAKQAEREAATKILKK